MRKSIDLHGLSHEESLVKVEEYLLLNSFNNDLDLELITGKSPKLQEKIINQVNKTKEILGNNIFYSIKSNSNQAILKLMNSLDTVSYTHLTLPTKRIV